MNKRDYYEILKINKNASKQEIKSAYRKLAKEFHPDRNKSSDAEERFKEVQEAYDVLSDEQKRKAYDQFGHAGTQGFGGGGYDTGFDFGDMSGFGDIFEQFFGGSFAGFGGNQSSPRRSTRGSDIEATLRISFNEAIFGIEKQIEYNKKSKCNNCGGSGAKKGTSTETCKTCAGQGKVRKMQQTFLGNFATVVTCSECSGKGKVIKDKCPECQGSGIQNERSSFKVKVPKGIPNGITLRFSGKGNAGENEGASGDLFLNIEVQPDDKFERRGDDIYLEIEIPPATAVLGTIARVPTVHGERDLEIPQGTQPETILRMKDLGAPKFRGSGNGDQYVKVLVEIPKKISREERELWERLKSIK